MPRKALTKDTRIHARETFLQVLSMRGIISDAADAAGLTRAVFYKWRDSDPVFADAWQEAQERAIENAEREAYRRAVEGWDEPVFGRVAKDQDGEIGSIRRHSDTMLTLVLKALKPEKYREKIDHEHRGTVNVEFVNNWREEADN